MHQIKSKSIIFLQTFYKLRSIRTFVGDVEIKFIRDRGLDHVVEKHRDLKPVLNLKNMLISEPSKSVPLSSIMENKQFLRITTRAVEFIRRYPFVFEEYFPGNVGIHPHVRLSSKGVELDAEEKLIYGSDLFRKNAAERLLRLLMLCRMNEVPLSLIDLLKFDLGLPDDYVDSLVPEFPDFFRVKKEKGVLELVCWSEELAVSVVEKMAKKADKGYEKGMPIEFPMKFSKGFEMDKKLKKWIDEWQKLPYYSPYENLRYLQSNSDESDRWAVAVLHELLHILVPKKSERDNVLCVGEFLGIKSRFKRALVHHPGIFYLSSKIGTYTVVLRDGYKRGLLVEKNPLMDIRNKYIHLMHKEVQKSKNVASSNISVSNQQVVKEAGVTEKEVREDEKERNEEVRSSDSDVDVIVKDENEDEDDDDEDDEEEDEEVERVRGGYSRGSNRVNEGGQVKGSLRSGRRGYDRVNEGQEARGGYRSGRRGLGKVNDDDQGRGGRGSGSGSGIRGFGKVNEERRARGGRRSGGRRFGEEQARGGRVGGGRRYGEEQGRGGQGSGRRRLGMVNEGTRKPRENRWEGNSH